MRKVRPSDRIGRAGGLAVLLSLSAGSAAFGQTSDAQDPGPPQTAPPPPASAAEAQLDDVIVTGSYIRGASDTGAVAVTIIGDEQIQTIGASSTGEILEYIAQAGAAEINSGSDGPNDARGDVATVNLRGLGTGNTLVLLNGRRIAAHAVNQDVGDTPRQITNVNAFPSSGIDRVEILRDGASALYGSDATAGVVNTILDAAQRDSELTARYSMLEGTGGREGTIEGSTGFRFNSGRTRLLLSGSIFDRTGIFASELGEQFRTVDKRGLLGDSPFATENTDFRNTSTSSPFGQFQVGSFSADGAFVGQRVRQGSTSLTSTTGTFHIQPCAFSGTRAVLGNFAEGCMGLDDGSLDTGLRFDVNSNQPNNARNEGVNIANDPITALGRQLISDATRYNAYAVVEHDLDGGWEAFGEALYYSAQTNANRASQSIDNGLATILIPRTNYWNPFGPVGSPNRLLGLNTSDVPVGGRDILMLDWRTTDLGPRFISTETETYRVLGGVRGEIGDWSAEGAVAYSSNTTLDEERNRISKTLLLAELSRSDPGAINPFGGPNANTQEQWDRVRISSTNYGRTALFTGDFRMSNPEVFRGWAAPIGLAFGVEYRNDYYSEDRDERLDGTIVFSSANPSGRSDVVGVSPTNDSEAGRDVYAAFGEALIPLHRGSGTFANDLTLQLAARGEYFGDIGDGALKPKASLSWQPLDAVVVRAAYSQGFRVPNLVQLNRGDVTRLQLGNEDYYRSDVTNDALSNGTTYLPALRRSNPDLKNEDTETYLAGASVDFSRLIDRDFLSELIFSVDYWRFEQDQIIGTFGDQEALAYDYLLRLQGSFNPAVVRAAPTAADIAAFDAFNLANPGQTRAAAGPVLFIDDPYINLDRQVADGFDMGMSARFDFDGIGRLNLSVDATYLNTLDVFRNDLLAALANEPAFGPDLTIIQTDRIEVEGNPRWRGSARATFRSGPVLIGASARYVGGYIDTSADIIRDGKTIFFPVQDNWRINLFGEVRLDSVGGTETRLRFGLNNILDEAPPLLDEAIGFDRSYHSVEPREAYFQIGTRF